MDYDSNILLSTVLNVNKPTFIYRDSNKVISSPEIYNNSKDLLFQVTTNINNKGINYEILTNSYKLDENNNLSPNCPWFILKPSKMNVKMNKYKLSPGDIIKIGRITLRIRDIKLSSKNDKSSDLNNSNFTSNIKNVNTLKTEGEPEDFSNIHKKKTNIDNNNDKKINFKKKSNPITLKKKAQKTENNLLTKIQNRNNVCRICYVEEEDNENPLLQPCICSGSMKFIHLSCLKHWISTRSCMKIDTTDNCSVYIIKEVECELCKTKFPDYISHEGKLHPLLDFSKEFENYLTFESLTVDKHKNKFIYVVSLSKNKKIKMGRGHYSDVLLSDISVSRVHCHLIVDNKKVFLEDNESKFGSLVLIQYPNIKIQEGITLHFQVGRTYIECKIKKNFNLFSCCNVEENSNLLYYYNQNEKYIQKHNNLIVKKDYNEEEESENDLQINNTDELKYPLNINDKFNNNSIIFQDKDKISDNEYFLMKYHKLNKNATKAMIDEDDNNDNKNNVQLIDNDKENDDNKDNKKEIQNEPEIDYGVSENINKTENENIECNNDNNNNNNDLIDNENKDTTNINNNNNPEEIRNSSNSNNQDSNNQDNSESGENNETMN